MATKVIMPKLSPTMEEGQVSRWLKKEGDKVSMGEGLAEIETDKATMEMQALGTGVLRKILIQEGESAALGQLIAIIGAPDEDISLLIGQVASNQEARAATESGQRRALIFANEGASLGALSTILKEADIAPLLPNELPNTSGGISIIIVERAAANVISICTNLRKQDAFKQVPMLVLLESADPEQVTHLTSLGADLFFKPVVAKALSRYLSTKLPKLVDRVEPEDPIAPRRSRVRKVDSQTQGETGKGNTPGAQEAGKAPEESRANKSPSEPTQPVLDNVVPISNRLLPVGAAAVLIPKGGVRCAQCGKWKVRREDGFCSKCGKALAILDMPATVVFEPRGNHEVGQLIELRNAGQNPLRMSLRVLGDNDLVRRFTLHTQTTGLGGGHAEHLLATFDAKGLDLTTRYQAVLEITSNAEGFSKRTIPLVIERLPIPRLVAEVAYLYVLGVENQWDFRVANDGGGTLTLSTARLHLAESGLPDSMLDLELLERVVVKEGQSEVVRARLPPLDVSPGRLIRKIIFNFEHRQALEADITFDVIRPARLAVQPPELDFGVVSTHRSGKLSLTFYNGGGEELVVASVTPSVDWLDCQIETPLTVQPGTAHVVDVQVWGGPERPGDHEAEIAIHSNSYEDTDQTIPFVVKFVEPGPYEAYIGIDFGTTASCVAILDKNDQPFVIQLDSVSQSSKSDPRLMPSVLFFQPDGSVLAGSEALINAESDPANAVTSIKRILGGKKKKMLGGREFDPTQLTSKVLGGLLLRTEKALFELGDYTTPKRAVVTVPVEVFDNQRRAMLDACQIAGLEVHGVSKQGMVIDEAHAAALHYLSKKAHTASSGESERLFIFDFGGGTLDCALIEIEVAGETVRLRTLASGGDPRLGGDDIDWALARLIGEKVKKEYPEFDVDCLCDEEEFNRRFGGIELIAKATRIHFKQKAESAKIMLTTARAFEFPIGMLLREGATRQSGQSAYVMNGQGQANVEVTVEKKELEIVVDPFLARAESVVQTICKRASVKPEDVHTILHAGRSSLLSIVRERINRLLPNAEDRSELIEPKMCVALGAAFWGQIKDQPRSNFEFVGGANHLIHDIGYVDFSTSKMRQEFVTVFPAQTEFPCEVVIEFPVNKEMITLRLAENRGSKETVEGNLEIRRTGRVRIDTASAKVPSLGVKFAIDENRVLQITAGGKTQNVELMDG